MTATTTPTSTDAPVIEGYRDLLPIGKGGSASIFEAWDSAGRHVAVKVLDDQCGGDATRQFHREIETLGVLTGIHGVVPLLDSGSTRSGVPFLTMPYYRRGSLQDLCEAEGPLDPLFARELVVRVATVLTRIHEAGVYHRDIKPANILIDDDFGLWLGDFGGASGPNSHDASTSVVYTIGYSPSESFLVGKELTGRPRIESVPIDVYSLGATLWALIAGRPPIIPDTNHSSGSDLAILHDQALTRVFGQPTRDTPRDITAAIGRATDPDPQRRPASMHGLVQLLYRPTDGADHVDLYDSTSTVTRPGDEASRPIVAGEELVPTPLRIRLLAGCGLIGLFAAVAAITERLATW
jgi:serine/threonine-protein kinase PknK